MDIRVTNKYTMVIGSQVILDEYYTSARIETPHTVHTFDTDEQRVTFIASMDAGLFPPIPEIGEWCEINKIYQYGTDKAKCLQEHNRMEYPIETTPALWLIIPTVVGYPVWVRPTGAHDSYHVGDIVHYPNIDSPLWICTQGDGSGNNSWQPGVYGWILYTP